MKKASFGRRGVALKKAGLGGWDTYRHTVQRKHYKKGKGWMSERVGGSLESPMPCEVAVL